LGAELQEMTPALAQSFGLKESIGALLVQVDADGPARAAGLVRGDVVTAFDGRAISHFTDLLQQIADTRPGRRVRIEFWRHGAKRLVSVTLSEDAGPRFATPAGSPPDWNDGLGLSLGELSTAQRLQLGSDGGLMVREATGLARSEGIRAGDIIVAVNDTRLDRVEDFRRKLAATTPGRMVALLVLRDRRLAYVPVLNAP
jgi:serine protease Do